MLPYFQFEKDERTGCSKIMRNLNAICRLVNSTRVIDVDKFDALCNETYKLLLQYFPFIMIVPALHRALAHISKKMRKMRNRGLVSLL